VDVQQSFLAALAEFHREGRYADLDLRALRQPSAFAAYLDELAAEAMPDTPRPSGIVPQTTLWWVEGIRFLGRLSIRHRLTVGAHVIDPPARESLT